MRRWGQNLLRQHLLRLPPLHLYRLRGNHRDPQHLLLDNHLRARLAFLRRRDVHSKLGSSLRLRARPLQDRHCVPVCPDNRGLH